jgi:hypothetical protein
MMKLHGCKKCQGTLILDKDEFGWYEECMQCGYSRDLPLDVPFNKDITEAPIPVSVITDEQVVKEKWKQNKIPAYHPFRKGSVLEEDTY